jgi:PKD domain
MKCLLLPLLLALLAKFTNSDDCSLLIDDEHEYFDVNVAKQVSIDCDSFDDDDDSQETNGDYEWRWGDGNQLKTVSKIGSHAYTTPGSYSMQVYVIESSKASVGVELTRGAHVRQCDAAFQGNFGAQFQLLVYAQRSDASNVNGEFELLGSSLGGSERIQVEAEQIVALVLCDRDDAASGYRQHRWTMGDGTEYAMARDAVAVSHRYRRGGSYDAVVHSYGADGGDRQAIARLSVTAARQRCPRGIAVPRPIVVGDLVSIEPCGAALLGDMASARWDFGDGTPLLNVSSAGAGDDMDVDDPVSHRYERAGIYQVLLRVVRAANGDVDTFAADALVADCSSHRDGSDAPSSIEVSGSRSLFGTGSTVFSLCEGVDDSLPGGSSLTEYRWNYGDGAASAYVEHGIVGQHRYTSSGRFVVSCLISAYSPTTDNRQLLYTRSAEFEIATDGRPSPSHSQSSSQVSTTRHVFFIILFVFLGLLAVTVIALAALYVWRRRRRRRLQQQANSPIVGALSSSDAYALLHREDGDEDDDEDDSESQA